MWNNTHYIKWSEKKQGINSAGSEFVNIHVFAHIHRKRLKEIYENVHIVYLQVGFFFILFYSVHPPK